MREYRLKDARWEAADRYRLDATQQNNRRLINLTSAAAHPQNVADTTPDREGNRALTIVSLGSGFFAVMIDWISVDENDPVHHVYQIVYVDSGNRYIYHWELISSAGLGSNAEKSRSLTNHEDVILSMVCVTRYAGVGMADTNNTYEVSDRETLIGVLRRCVEYIINNRVAPKRRYQVLAAAERL